MASSNDRLIPLGRAIFAVGMFGLGILCILSRDFIVGRPPAWPSGFDPNPALGIVTGAILLVASLRILAGKRGDLAAFVIAALIFLLSVLREVPQFMNDWLNGYKTLALLGGALIVASSFLHDANTIRWKSRLILAGSIFLSVFFIAGGYAHFKFADFVMNGFIPSYIPFHAFWTYFCGVCLIAGGIGIHLRRFERLAALLCGVMVLGWFFLLHIPRFLANVNDVGDRLGLCESFVIGGIFLTLAGLHRDKN